MTEEHTCESLDDKIIKMLSGLSDKEKQIALTQLTHTENRANTFFHDYNSKHIKIAVMPDQHYGSKYHNKKIHDDFIKVIKKEKIDAVYNVGDIIEGMSNRDGHIFEIEILGTSAQVNYAAERLKEITVPLYFITGNHDEWAEKRSNQGVEVGDMIERQVPGSKFLGKYVADINLGKGVIMRLSHEGNTAYALSYSLQKRINGLQGGTKPNIILNGHLHKMMYMNYRNIHAFEVGAFEEQTPFMAMKGSPAMPGFWVLDIYFNKLGINKLVQTAYPYY